MLKLTNVARPFVTLHNGSLLTTLPARERGTMATNRRSDLGRIEILVHGSQSRLRHLATVFVLVLVDLGCPPPTPADKRPMTFMDVIEMRSVGAGKISSDGNYVVYTVSIPQWKAGKNFTDIFVAATDGSSSPRQLTFTKEKNETQPEWARDSRAIGFLSDREGADQVYLMRIDGGEAQKISDAKDGVNAFSFSRDGKWLAFSAGKADERQIWLAPVGSDAAPVPLTKHATPVKEWGWAEDSSRIFFTAADRFDTDEQKRIDKKFDVKIIDPERSPVHLWSVPVSERGERPEKAEKRWTSGGDYSVDRFTFSRDGAYLAFRTASTSRHANKMDDEDSEIYLLALVNGAIRRLTNNRVTEGMPRFSPDSKWLAFVAPDEFDYLRNEKIYVASTADGPVRKLLANWDHSARNIHWSQDSRTIYFYEALGVDSHLFALDVASQKLTQVTHERGVVVGTGQDEETDLFLVSFTSPTDPADYYVARPQTLGERARWIRVSRANPQVEALVLGEYEALHWKSTDGQMVEGILVRPLAYEKGKRYPLIVQLHGGPAGADQNRFSSNWGNYVHVFAAGGYAVFLPNYRGSDAYGEKFRTQIAGDYFKQGYDDIISGVDYLVERGIADPDKLGMMGWSAGGHWSDWTLTHTNRFKAISTGAGAVDWISMYAETDMQAPREYYFKGKPWENWDHFVAVSPLRYIQNAKTPTLIHVGEADPRVPKPQSDELFMALKKLGIPVEYIVYPRMPHGLIEPRFQMVKMVAEYHWFEKWIRGKEGWFDWKPLLASVEDSKPDREKKPAGEKKETEAEVTRP